MTGKSHKALGMAIGFGIAAWGFKHGDTNQIFVFAPLISAAGAMIPDVDHDSSKLGRNRKKIQDFAIKGAVTAGVGLLGYWIWYLYSLKDWNSLILLIVTFVIPTGIFVTLSKTKFGKKMTKFATTHRGIMHTLFIPFLIIFPIRYYDNYTVQVVLVCLAAGCVSHLLTDLMNKAGIPILFPFTTKRISILPVKTGSSWEYIICGILIAAVVVISFVVI